MDKEDVYKEALERVLFDKEYANALRVIVKTSACSTIDAIYLLNKVEDIHRGTSLIVDLSNKGVGRDLILCSIRKAIKNA